MKRAATATKEAASATAAAAVVAANATASAAKDAANATAAVVAPGFSVRNETPFPILFVMSQLTPLHWTKVMPGETCKINCGRVFFTISTELYNEETEPTASGVALRLAAITAASVSGLGLLIGVGVIGGISGATSSKGVKMDGVYADGRCAVVTGETIEGGVYALKFLGIENK